MTTDTKLLLLLPEAVDVIFSPDGNLAALDVFTADQMRDYARACVAHATAAQDAEIEALKVEVVVQRTRADAMAGEAIKHEARAERLAEALRDLLALPEAASQLRYLDKGIGTATEQAAWLQARAAYHHNIIPKGKSYNP